MDSDASRRGEGGVRIERPEADEAGALVASRRGHWASLDYHGRLLADVNRMEAYEQAIHALVEPGMVVLDVGTGTGVLAMLAARRGAARVHAVESTPVAALAAELVRHNGLDGIVAVHRADIVEMTPIEPVDLVIGEFMGRFLADDQMLGAVAAAVRWLKPGGRVCPARVEVKLAPAGNLLPEALQVFRRPVLGLELAPALKYAMNCCYAAHTNPEALIGPAATFLRYEPGAGGGEPTGPFEAELRLPLTAISELMGLVGWWEATLARGVVLSTAPGIATHWAQFYLPLPATLVGPGDVVEAAVRLYDAGTSWEWEWRGAVQRTGAEAVAFALESVERMGERED